MTLEASQMDELFPGCLSAFLAPLNSRMEDAEPGERADHVAVRCEMPEFRSKEETLGKDVVSGARNMFLRTDSGILECGFVRRTTKSSRKSGTYSHETIMRIVSERKTEAPPKTSVSREQPSPGRDTVW